MSVGAKTYDGLRLRAPTQRKRALFLFRGERELAEIGFLLRGDQDPKDVGVKDRVRVPAVRNNDRNTGRRGHVVRGRGDGEGGIGEGWASLRVDIPSWLIDSFDGIDEHTRVGILHAWVIVGSWMNGALSERPYVDGVRERGGRGEELDWVGGPASKVIRPWRSGSKSGGVPGRSVCFSFLPWEMDNLERFAEEVGVEDVGAVVRTALMAGAGMPWDYWGTGVLERPWDMRRNAGWMPDLDYCENCVLVTGCMKRRVWAEVGWGWWELLCSLPVEEIIERLGELSGTVLSPELMNREDTVFARPGNSVTEQGCGSGGQNVHSLPNISPAAGLRPHGHGPIKHAFFPLVHSWMLRCSTMCW
jgi:hypothetical protein